MNDYIKNLEASQMKESVDEFNVGDTVKVHNRIKEGNKERIQIFEGTVVKRQGGSNRETFTVRKISSGCGVEKTWPVHSPFVEKIEVVRKGKVRRAKLYFLRDRKSKYVQELVRQQRLRSLLNNKACNMKVKVAGVFLLQPFLEWMK